MRRNTAGGYAAIGAILAMAGLAGGCGNGNAPATRQTQGAAAPPGVRMAAAPTSQDYYTVVQQIYVSYFGRPADAAGLQYWAERMLAANGPTTLADLYNAYNTNTQVRDIVNSFALSKESQDLYAGDNGAFIEAVYQNLFSRPADPAGKAYWAGLIDSGALTRSAAAINLAAGARDTDTTIINNKTSVASAFTSALSNGLKQSSYSGLSANEVVRTMLRGITLSASADASIGNTLASLVNNYRAAARAEGSYAGTLQPPAEDNAFRALILENGDFWGIYGQQAGDNFSASGLIQGKGAYGPNNTYTITSLVDYGSTPVISMSLSGAYGGGALNGQLSTPVGTVAFSGAQNPDADYQYEAAPNYAALVGPWVMKNTDNITYNINFNADGSLSGNASVCTFTGRIGPRASGKNVFDISATLGAQCPQPNATVNGIAIGNPVANSSQRQLIIAVVTADSSAGWVLFGTR